MPNFINNLSDGPGGNPRKKNKSKKRKRWFPFLQLYEFARDLINTIKGKK